MSRLMRSLFALSAVAVLFAAVGCGAVPGKAQRGNFSRWVPYDAIIGAESLSLPQPDDPVLKNSVVVVYMDVSSKYGPPGQMSGTGFIVAESSDTIWIATAAHMTRTFDPDVAVDGLNVQFCCLGTNPIYRVRRNIFFDDTADVALISVDRPSEYRPRVLRLRTDESPPARAHVEVLGNPNGRLWRTGHGLIQRVPRDPQFHGTDMGSPIWGYCPADRCGPGSSGSPVLINGRLAGMLTRGSDIGAQSLHVRVKGVHQFLIEPASAIRRVLRACGKDPQFPECRDAAIAMRPPD